MSLFSPLKNLQKKSARFFKMDILKNVQNEIPGPRMLQKSDFTRICCKYRKNHLKIGCIIFYFYKTEPFRKLRENRKKPIKFRLFKNGIFTFTICIVYDNILKYFVKYFLLHLDKNRKKPIKFRLF